MTKINWPEYTNNIVSNLEKEIHKEWFENNYLGTFKKERNMIKCNKYTADVFDICNDIIVQINTEYLYSSISLKNIMLPIIKEHRNIIKNIKVFKTNEKQTERKKLNYNELEKLRKDCNFNNIY